MVLVAAISEALRGDVRFADLNEQPWGPDDVAWFPVGHHLIAKFIKEGRSFAIGPNVAFQLSQQPGYDDSERAIMAYQNYAAIFTLSRWYSALQQKHYEQKSRHYILDYPLPLAWQEKPYRFVRDGSAMVFVKGGPAEHKIANELARRFNVLPTVYGSYTRDDLFYRSGRSRACFYVSREDHYPLAAVEIGLMGCPIISDEKSCPVIIHGVNGICAAVRERGENDPFAWTADAADRLAVEWRAATQIDRVAIRGATIRKHSPELLRERVAAQLGLG